MILRSYGPSYFVHESQVRLAAMSGCSMPHSVNGLERRRRRRARRAGLPGYQSQAFMH
jgi:hypothetical protein